jgi:predicted nucleic acid-binding Zn ribbon protein
MSENETQICPKCGAPAKEGDVFCRACGAKHLAGVSETKPPREVKRVCPNCGNTLRPAARFCDLCGEECVKMQRERRRRKRKKSGCFLVFAAVLLWLAAVVSAIVIYDAVRDKSPKKVLTIIWENFFASDSDEGAKEETGETSGAAVSEDSYEIVISYDTLPVVTPIAEDEPDISPPDLRSSGEERQNPPENSDEGSRTGDPGERDEVTDTAKSASSGAESDSVVLVSPLSASLESRDAGASEDKRQDSGAWTEQDSEGYSTVAADDRFFTSSQTPSLRGIVTADHVRVRSAPNTASRIRRQLDSGAEVELVRRFSSGKERYYWFEVRDSGGSGWIYGEFIKPEAGGSEGIINTSP